MRLGTRTGVGGDSAVGRRQRSIQLLQSIDRTLHLGRVLTPGYRWRARGRNSAWRCCSKPAEERQTPHPPDPNRPSSTGRRNPGTPGLP